MSEARLGVLIRQLQGALGGNRIVRGTVGSGGTIVSGHGWTVVKNATGDYTVTFTMPFTAAPTVLVSAGSTSAFYTVKLFGGVAPTATSFRVLCFLTSTLASQDGEFHFTAIG